MSKARKYAWTLGSQLPTLDAHSEAKHAVFRAYLREYVRRLTCSMVQDRFRLSIIDGFCGGGRYLDTTGCSVAGSPLIFLEEASALEASLQSERRKSFALNVDFTFVDEAVPHCQFLRSEIRNSPYSDMLKDNIQIIPSSFEDIADNIISSLQRRRGKRRALFFLDQYGYSDVSMSLLRKIMNGVEGAEIILTFAVDALINYISDSDNFAKAVFPLELTASQISELKRIWEGSEEGARAVVQNALFQHVARASGAPYSSPFFVRSKTSKRAYWLVHLSKHHTARDVMGEIHWSYGNASYHHGREGLLALGFDGAFSEPSLPFDFEADARDRSLQRTSREAPDLIYAMAQAGGGAVSFEEFFARLCSFTPVTKAMLGEVVASLREAGDIKIVGQRGSERSRTKKIDWTDQLMKPDKPTLFSMWNPLLRQ